MATGTIKWDDAWTAIATGVALTQGGDIQDESAVIDMGDHVQALLSVSVLYSNHAKATAGFSIRVRREVADTPAYETEQGAAVAIELPFTQNDTEAKVISLSGNDFDKFVLQMDWGNTTASAVATYTTKILYASMDIS